MYAQSMNIIGIALTTIGSVIALITIMKTDPQMVGTWGEPEQRRKDAPKDKHRAYVGCALIVIGGLFQILGQIV